MAEIIPAPEKSTAAKRVFAVRILQDKCKSCQLCIVACPRKNLEFSKTLNKKGVVFVQVKEKKDCNGCKACVLICPDNCITIVEE